MIQDTTDWIQLSFSMSNEATLMGVSCMKMKLFQIFISDFYLVDKKP